MTTKEISELLVLKGWTRQELADKLELCKNTIDRWFCTKAANRRTPSFAECHVMRTWLNEAREETRRQPA